ncbi:MAG TPA: hypothetical protein VND23_09140 [Acidimicrobiales bacterium]|nr:hypothetical protein [Acidimicrobiales bacterium]
MNENQAGRRGRPGDWARDLDRKARSTTAADRELIRAFFAGTIDSEWFVGEPEIVVDDYEIQVLGTLPPPQLDADAEHVGVAERARAELFREETRERRVQIAQLAEARHARKVSWGVVVGGTRALFTTASVPVMTRLQLRQRQTLDTLVDAGVARSRSDALAWCVELVTRHESEWIEELRAALGAVEAARAAGPSSAR